jgi:4,5-DOPA dioxygenase extradiol
LSLDYNLSPRAHYELAKELSFLRGRGVLIIGSGNIVHNLRKVNFHTEEEFEWAKAADAKLKKLILAGDHRALIEYDALGAEVATGIPTPEHYLPLLYVLGLKNESDEVSVFNDDRLAFGSLSMTSVKIG